MRDWPFSLAELTAGLRRYFAEPSLRVLQLDPQPSRQGGRGVRVSYSLRTPEPADEPLTVDCVLRQSERAGRAGLAHPGMREAGVYRALASQLPVTTPALIAADAAGQWLLLEAVEARPISPPCQPAAHRQAVVALARLHERFWGLADDLAAYPWLARPLTLDYEIHVYAAAQALDKIVREAQPAALAQSAEVLATLGQIILQAEAVVEPLRALPFTLVHGNFWEGCLLLDEDAELVVLDWGLAGIGPGVLDLVTLIMRGRWERGCAPKLADQAVLDYRAEIAQRVGYTWDDAAWQQAWDHALLWRFLQEILIWAASATPEAYTTRARAFEAVWLQPVLDAARRRLVPFTA